MDCVGSLVVYKTWCSVMQDVYFVMNDICMSVYCMCMGSIR